MEYTDLQRLIQTFSPQSSASQYAAIQDPGAEVNIKQADNSGGRHSNELYALRPKNKKELEEERFLKTGQTKAMQEAEVNKIIAAMQDKSGVALGDSGASAPVAPSGSSGGSGIDFLKTIGSFISN